MKSERLREERPERRDGAFPSVLFHQHEPSVAAEVRENAPTSHHRRNRIRGTARLRGYRRHRESRLASVRRGPQRPHSGFPACALAAVEEIVEAEPFGELSLKAFFRTISALNIPRLKREAEGPGSAST